MQRYVFPDSIHLLLYELPALQVLYELKALQVLKALN